MSREQWKVLVLVRGGSNEALEVEVRAVSWVVVSTVKAWGEGGAIVEANKAKGDDGGDEERGEQLLT